MGHLPTFIGDLAIILISAGIATLLFKWLKQPVVLGYILAGFIAGPHITWLPTVADMGNVNIWAEIGVIFLLFALGLEFSFKRLIAVGGTASIATLINLGSMIIIGYLVGKSLGWDNMNSVFLGGMLSMSSTTIIIKAFNDMGLQKQRFAGIVFGMLIVEDLAAIVMMVMLSTVAVSSNIEGTALVSSVLKLLFFVLIWFIGGIYLIPTILKKLNRFLNGETLLIVAIGLCLGMVLFATHVGFSAALGAFIMGSIFAETIAVHRIEHLLEPIKNFFGAVFFVSVGMMIDPGIIAEYAGLIAILVGVVLIGRIFFATIGVLASGEGLKVSLQAGFSLAQIGEFSFIIATLGTSLGVISEILYPIIVAVSVITTFTTPYCIKMATPVYKVVEKRIPAKWGKLINGYASSSYVSVNHHSVWKEFLQSVLKVVAIYFVIAFAILTLCEQFVTPFIVSHLPDVWGRILSAVLTLLLMAPFLRSIMVKRNRSEAFKKLWEDSHFNRGMLISLIAFRMGVCLTLVLMVLIPLFPELAVLMVVVGLLVMLLIIFFQGFKTQSIKLEKHFLDNLNYKEKVEEQKRTVDADAKEKLRSKDIRIESMIVSAESHYVGKSLCELDIRSTSNVNIVSIVRGERRINIPNADECIYPHDKLILAGADNDIQSLIEKISERNNKLKEKVRHETEAQGKIYLSKYIIEGSPLVGKTISQLNLQQNTGCMIICIDRNDESITDFHADFVLEAEDILIIAGESVSLKHFTKNICEGCLQGTL